MTKPTVRIELSKGFERIVNESVARVAAHKQRQMDQLALELKGKPLAEAKRRLKQVWEDDGGLLTDPELTEYAQLLVDGGQVTFRTEKFKMP